ncbi:MAG: glycosyltransferase family 4 protein [Ruminococcaceae bacterium]|nr:glycosyltransferase family 4 protein [Oscillospiraceae bacterium]
MNITFILKGGIQILPPMLPRIVQFAEKKHNVNFICTTIVDEHRSVLEKMGVKCFETKHKNTVLKKHSKIRDWMGFRKNVWQIVEKEGLGEGILYVCSADTALALGKKLKKYRYALQSNELYDTNEFYRKNLKDYAVGAVAFVVPEYIRANIFMYWYGLKKMPYVIPNSPYISSDVTEGEIEDGIAKETLEKLKDKKIVLYQGVISAGDRSLGIVAEALKKKADGDYVLLLVGRNKNNSYEAIKDIFPETYYIPFITPPKHLQVTRRAYLGILSYDRISLNNIFCAPNKIYEYSAFGIPMLGNNIPGLRDSIVVNGMGQCADFEEVDNVVDAINSIESNHEAFSVASKKFYETSNHREVNEKLMIYLEELCN